LKSLGFGAPRLPEGADQYVSGFSGLYDASG